MSLKKKKKNEVSARSVVKFEGVLPEAAPCVVYASFDLAGQIGIGG